MGPLVIDSVTGMFKEFRDFITTGNVITLAVGFIMGVAFQGVVSSLVENVIMPIVAIPFGQPNFSDLVWRVDDSVIMYGSFLTALVVFLLTALAVFLFIVKPYNALQERFAREKDDESTGPTEVDLLIEIRDSLRSRPA